MNSRVRFGVLIGLVAAALATPFVVGTLRIQQTAGEGAFKLLSTREFKARQSALEKAFTSERFAQALRAGKLEAGGPVAHLIVPRLGVDLIVVEGVSGDSLKAGAGHYPDTALPGATGNVAIAGHRTGFGQPFLYLDRLQRDDTLVLITPEHRFIYTLMPPFDGHANPWVTDPLDWQPVGPVEGSVVTLTTADPPHSATNRLIARFALTKKD